MNDKVEKSEFRKVKASATISLTEYSDGTVECIPTFDPEIDLTLGSHAMISSMYQDMNNFLNNASKPEEGEVKDEDSNEHSATE